MFPSEVPSNDRISDATKRKIICSNLVANQIKGKFVAFFFLFVSVLKSIIGPSLNSEWAIKGEKTWGTSQQLIAREKQLQA